MFLKRIPPNTMEVAYQNVAADLGFAPKILGVQKKNDHWMVGMEDLKAMSIADYYGTDPEAVPEWIWVEIRKMVTVLLNNGIEYRDITGYNFIQKVDKIYMIDFGDARLKTDKLDWFVKEFLEGENSWNPDYK